MLTELACGLQRWPQRLRIVPSCATAAVECASALGGGMALPRCTCGGVVAMADRGGDDNVGGMSAPQHECAAARTGGASVGGPAKVQSPAAIIAAAAAAAMTAATAALVAMASALAVAGTVWRWQWR